MVLGMIKCHTMNKSKIAITVSPLVLNRLDAWVQNDHFASRSEAIEKAVEAQLQRLERTRLSAQCALLNMDEEQAMADEGLVEDTASWPAF
jgi:Arc/MetJ-type ribon-helix-helix transcriptional regulator